MSPCAQEILDVSGTAHGNNIWKVLLRAFLHMMSNGRQECNGGDCDAGKCKFGLTGINEDIQIVEDADGNGVTVTVSGSGACFCGDT